MRRTVFAVIALLAVGALAVHPAHSAAPVYTAPIRLVGAGGGTEPRVVKGPDGTLWTVTSKSNGVAIVYSSNDGITWTKTKTDPTGQGSPTIDTDIAVTQDGRVLATELDTQGLQMRVFYTDDRGETWKTSKGSALADQDRQWLAAGPNHRVYLLWHNFATGEASHNMWVQTSIDDGESFLPPTPVTLPGSQAWLDLQCADSGGPKAMSVDQNTGRLYIVWPSRSGPAGGCTAQPLMFNIVYPSRLWTATSPDNTLGSWTTSLAVDGAADGRIVSEQGSLGTIDQAGNMYVVYAQAGIFPNFEGAGLYYRWAPPDLSHWSEPITIAAPGAGGNALVHPVGGAPGKLAVAWYQGESKGSTVDWFTTVAQITDAFSATPQIVTTRVSTFPSYEWTAAELLGACGDPTSPIYGFQNGLLCPRGTDVWGLTIDANCNLVVSWPSVSNAGGGKPGTFITTQTGGDTIC